MDRGVRATLFAQNLQANVSKNQDLRLKMAVYVSGGLPFLGVSPPLLPSPFYFEISGSASEYILLCLYRAI
jgi:hypothetical protein